MCTGISFDDPALTGPGAPDGALSRAMAHAGAARDIWQLARLADWREVLEQMRFSSDWNEPYTSGALRPPAPPHAPEVLREWHGPLLILHGAREMTFPVGVARRLHSEVPDSVLVEIPEAAHMAHFDNRPAWVSAVRRFLRDPARR